MMKKFCALCCCLCLVACLSTFALAADKSISGIVTDDKCTSGSGNPDCVKRCLEKGAKVVLVTDEDKSVLAIDNPEKIKGHEGHHVSVTGTVSNNTLHIDTIKMAEDKGGK